MVNATTGIICVGLAEERVDELKLPQMVVRNTESHQTAFTHSVDYKIGTTTGYFYVFYFEFCPLLFVSFISDLGPI